MKHIKLIVILSAALSVFGCSNANTGTAVGATSGFLIGATAGPIGAGVGLGVGALAGVAVGSAIDHCAGKPVCNDTTHTQRS